MYRDRNGRIVAVQCRILCPCNNDTLRDIPVIAVDNRGHREIVINGVNGYIINNNVDDLIEKFMIIYKDRKKYDELKKNCYNTAKRFFLKNSLEKMSKIYNL